MHSNTTVDPTNLLIYQHLIEQKNKIILGIFIVKLLYKTYWIFFY